jgi:6-pyruvoyltetrahydropterin/6-carboxytetrahydropterin synthase
MKAHLSRRYRFSASHRLHVTSLPDDVNRATFGKCNNPHGHGHNYVVEVCFSGQIDENGMVLDLAALDLFAAKRVVDLFDVENLNALPAFRNVVPTTENLAVVLYGIFSTFAEAKLERLRVEETAKNSFEYTGGTAVRS